MIGVSQLGLSVSVDDERRGDALTHGLVEVAPPWAFHHTGFHLDRELSTIDGYRWVVKRYWLDSLCDRRLAQYSRVT